MSHKKDSKEKKRIREAKRRAKFNVKQAARKLKLDVAAEGFGDFGGSPVITPRPAPKRGVLDTFLGAFTTPGQTRRGLSPKQQFLENVLDVGATVPIAGFGAGGAFRGSVFRSGSGSVAKSGRLASIPAPVKRIIGVGLSAAAGAAIEETVQRTGVLSPTTGGQLVPPPGTGKGRLPGIGGMLPSKDTVVKVWTTGTANFARLLDGRIAVQKKDGTIKTYRPQKHIVIPRNPRVGTLIRADKRLKRLTKGLKKVVK